MPFKKAAVAPLLLRPVKFSVSPAWKSVTVMPSGWAMDFR
jgi:hypothetical protein